VSRRTAFDDSSTGTSLTDWLSSYVLTSRAKRQKTRLGPNQFSNVGDVEILLWNS